ncbi:MAG: exodeoxyribonuclease V subunit alpha [Gammaproteobacteria bacterium]|nr:exodeoxyribonuclease V subunit alpha [Gammaproteobacteria bacterium]MYA66027.1 exodeoxyribonuclease V subunit alpha [Gammaproteobacteria bacterium]MYG96511.1 exodeoxyribonuclease V subunit alpha [Gammaproteobacteria bacterium]MYH47918.1 exodeoxyribonuclease V subunit alpha [Gammaproteobacteria bacterium]MYL13755.1 exodeoxyribonuclease V subunit alpha [Gammaproteobacteria bacterium]
MYRGARRFHGRRRIMTLPPAIETLFRQGHIGEIDRHLAALIAELTGEDDGEAPLAAAIASRHTRQGHTCIDLNQVAGRHWPAAIEPDSSSLMLPELETWLARLAASPAIAGQETVASRPLVLDASGRLYLNRMWRRERSVAVRLRELASRETPEPAELQEALDELFEDIPPNALPRKAAHVAVSRHLCCISGGPGTGKTTTVARIMMALVKAGQVTARDIAFAAPTGKAAARLQEATRESLRDMHGGGSLPEELTVEVSTVHRWLMKSEAERGLARVLIIDEASMVDIHLMSRVLEALPARARLILLGDASQLSSVEPGSVFADICGAAAGERSPLRHCVVNLEHNWRFDQNSGIGRLAAAINSGDSGAVEQALQQPQEQSVGFEALDDSAAFGELAERFAREHYAPMVKRFRSMDDVTQLESCENPFRHFMALCAHRRGAFGSERFNRQVEQRLRALGLVSADEEFYVGRPIIVTRNDHGSGLANGDTGIVVDSGPDANKAANKVWFPDLREPNGDIRLVTPQRLPPHESFYALTVHRSQGSEYDEVAVVPGLAESPVNTRELLYTAITRARNRVVIHGASDGIKAAAERETARGSGLKDALL